MEKKSEGAECVTMSWKQWGGRMSLEQKPESLDSRFCLHAVIHSATVGIRFWTLTSFICKTELETYKSVVVCNWSVMCFEISEVKGKMLQQFWTWGRHPSACSFLAAARCCQPTWELQLHPVPQKHFAIMSHCTAFLFYNSLAFLASNELFSSRLCSCF